MKVLLSTIVIILFCICASMVLVHAADARNSDKYSVTVENAKRILQKFGSEKLKESEDAWGRRWTFTNSTDGVILFMSHGVDTSDVNDDIYIRYDVSAHSFSIEFKYKGRIYRDGFFE